MSSLPQTSLKRSLIFLWISHLFMDFFTGIWPVYKMIANVDLVRAGMIMGISGFVGEIFQVFFGYFCDRGHRKKILLLGFALSSSVIWLTFVDQISHFFLLLLLLMIGSGSFHPASVGIAGSLTKTQKGKFILFYASGGAIGLGISQLAFTSLLAFFDGDVLILLVPVAILFFAIAKHSFPNQDSPASSLSLKRFFEPIKHCRKPLFFLYLSQMASQAVVLAFIFLLPDLLRSRGVDSWLYFGGGHLCFILGSALTMVPAGTLSDKYGQKSVLLFVVLGAIVGLYAFLLCSSLSFSSTILSLILLGACLGIINPVIVSWGNRLVPESPSTVSALLMGCAWCFSHLGATAVGMIAPSFSQHAYAYALGMIGLLLLLVLFFIFLMPSPLTQKVLSFREDSSLIPDVENIPKD